jgi:hypothetical protein
VADRVSKLVDADQPAQIPHGKTYAAVSTPGVSGGVTGVPTVPKTLLVDCVDAL